MRRNPMRPRKIAVLITAGILGLSASVFAQQSYPPQELERLVAPIALYPDPLLAQVLAAATYPADIPDSARWADQHHYITGDHLARTMADDRLRWDPSMQALLALPAVLDSRPRE